MSRGTITLELNSGSYSRPAPLPARKGLLSL
jgi:hypothetical protein